MKFSKLFYLLTSLALLSISACEDTTMVRPQAGDWTLTFQVANREVPVGLFIDSSGIFTIVNAEEEIRLDSNVFRSDSFFIEMPLFQSTLSGKIWRHDSISGQWRDRSRSMDYVIPFTATPRSIRYPSGISEQWETYGVTFSPDSAENRYEAVLKMASNRESPHIKGTFLTETGDYRYLSGLKTDSTLYLSCFDGAHLFYFEGELLGDSIKNGFFSSGSHWSEPWKAIMNESASLSDPDSLTFIVEDKLPFGFEAHSLQDDLVQFSPPFFQDKVTVVQIFGSWCPNCADESRWLKTMFERYQDQGFQVIPVAFERGDDQKKRTAGVEKQWGELAMPYPSYIGGKSGKGEAGEVFSMLSQVMSYPTTIFLDKKGEIRKIHTGFYGPGTGKYFIHHTEKLEMFIKQLLEE